MEIIYNIISPITFLVSWIFYGIHEVLQLILGSGPGGAWIASIILLTIVVRIGILPIFLKSIKSTRKMQALQPEIKAIQKKYKGKKDQESKNAMAQETMALYQKHGANPMGGCLPLLIQSPFFMALWSMLHGVQDISTGAKEPIGPISQNVASDIESSSFFGVKISSTLQTVGDTAGTVGIVVIVIMIAIMCIVMFISQRMVMLKNMPIAAKEGPQFKMQKSMVYIFPLMYIFSGVMFPVGLLLYMMTTNLWTLGQGIWQLEFMPTPGSEAAEKKAAKVAKWEAEEKEALKVSNPEKYEELYGVPDERKQQRVQPKKKSKKTQPSKQASAKSISEENTEKEPAKAATSTKKGK
jgi:YidC/Oxa1 family membrane protein insertase